MQYILTQEEMDRRTEAMGRPDAKHALEYARNKILKLSKLLCVNDRTKPAEGEKTIWYCGECPISSIGSEHVKDISYETSKLLCPLSRDYSK